MKRVLKITLITVAILIKITIIVMFICCFLLGIFAVFLSIPLRPNIKYGEFSFELLYEIDGEKHTLNDTLVCEFDGFNIDEGRGITREWKEHFKNEQKNELYAFRVEQPNYYKKGYPKPDYNQIVLKNIGQYKIVFITHPAEYFLGEPDYKITEGEPFIQVYDTDIGYYKAPDQSNEFLEMHNFKIISWYCDEPIKNNFK
jgi:hypothetical protein